MTRTYTSELKHQHPNKQYYEIAAKNVKPSSIERVLAFSPLPITGEMCAEKVAQYMVAKEEVNLVSEITGRLPNWYCHDENLKSRFKAIRGVAYIVPAAVFIGLPLIFQNK